MNIYEKYTFTVTANHNIHLMLILIKKRSRLNNKVCRYFLETGFLLLLWITSDAAVDTFPDSFSKNEISSSKNLVGVSSQIIANVLIQVSVHHDESWMIYIKLFNLGSSRIDIKLCLLPAGIQHNIGDSG